MAIIAKFLAVKILFAPPWSAGGILTSYYLLDYEELSDICYYRFRSEIINLLFTQYTDYYSADEIKEERN